MGQVNIENISKYQYNTNLQIFGVMLSALMPICMAVEFFKAHDDDMPKILNNEQATTICLQEHFDKTSITDKGFHIDLSKPEIEACATTKITQSRQVQSDYIKDREENGWKPYAAAGIFTLFSLAVAGYGHAVNKRLRRENPGIEKSAPNIRL